MLGDQLLYVQDLGPAFPPRQSKKDSEVAGGGSHRINDLDWITLEHTEPRNKEASRKNRESDESYDREAQPQEQSEWTSHCAKNAAVRAKSCRN